MEVGAIKQAYNNEVIHLKNNLNQARIQVIHKLTRRAKTFAAKKGPDKLTEKLKRKSESAIKEVLILKKIKARDLGRFIVTQTGALNEYLNKPQVDHNKACARLLLHKALQEKYTLIKNKFSNIPIKDLLMSRQERLKLKKEQKEQQKNKKKGKGTNLDNAQGDWSVQDIDGPKNGGDLSSNVEGSNDSAGSDQDIEQNSDDDDVDDAEQLSGDEESENEDNEEEEECNTDNSVEDKDGSVECMPIDEIKNKKVLKVRDVVINKQKKVSKQPHKKTREIEMKVTDDDQLEGDKDNDDQLVCDKDNDDSNGDDGRDVSGVEESLKLSTPNKKPQEKNNQGNKKPIIQKKPRDNKNLNEKIQSRKFKRKIDDVPVQNNKIVDSFFITSSGENYMSVVEPRQQDEVKEIHMEGNRKLRRAVMFGHVPKIKPKQSGFISNNKFNKNNSSVNNNYGSKFNNSRTLNNDKRTDFNDRKFKNNNDRFNSKSNVNISEPEKLHPSWEAKKKKSGILPFEGKKIVFDES